MASTWAGHRPRAEVGLDALYERAAMLRRALRDAELVDGLVERMELDLGEASVVATAGLCGLIARLCRTVDPVDPWLTLRGLRLLQGATRPEQPDAASPPDRPSISTARPTRWSERSRSNPTDDP